MGTRAHALYTYYYTRAFVSSYTDGARPRLYYIMRYWWYMYIVHTYRYGVWTGHCEFFHENNKFNDACAAEEKERKKDII